jgi:hypothetical protein
VSPCSPKGEAVSAFGGFYDWTFVPDGPSDTEWVITRREARVTLEAVQRAAESRETFLTDQLNAQTENASIYLARLAAYDRELAVLISEWESKGPLNPVLALRELRAALGVPVAPQERM